MGKDYTSEILDLITEYNKGLITDSDMQGIIDAIIKKSRDQIWELWDLENDIIEKEIQKRIKNLDNAMSDLDEDTQDWFKFQGGKQELTELLEFLKKIKNLKI